MKPFISDCDFQHTQLPWVLLFLNLGNAPSLCVSVSVSLCASLMVFLKTHLCQHPLCQQWACWPTHLKAEMCQSHSFLFKSSVLSFEVVRCWQKTFAFWFEQIWCIWKYSRELAKKVFLKFMLKGQAVKETGMNMYSNSLLAVHISLQISSSMYRWLQTSAKEQTLKEISRSASVIRLWIFRELMWRFLNSYVHV